MALAKTFSKKNGGTQKKHKKRCMSLSLKYSFIVSNLM
jgi:hypothetical protein